MKLRNRLLALVLLFVFVGVGILFFNKWVVQKPFGVILFVSDGVVPSNLAAARIYAGGTAYRLEMEQLPAVAILRNDSADFSVPDAAAASSAIATGYKTRNRVLSMDEKGKPLETLFSFADRAGRECGFVTNSQLSDPAAAPFFASAKSLDSSNKWLDSLIERKAPSLVLSGGRGEFFSETKGGTRKDERDLLVELRQKGVSEIRTAEELNGLGMWNTGRIFGLFTQGLMPFRDQHPDSEMQPSLSKMTQRAIELLQTNQNGYFLVVHAGLVAEAARANQGERTLNELNELDRAVKIARQYAGDNTMIIVAGTTVTGGLRLNGYPFSREQGVAILGTNPLGMPSLTWSTGPNGPRELAFSSTEPAAFFTPSAAMVASDVLAFGSGPGTENLHGILQNTAIFDLLKAKF